MTIPATQTQQEVITTLEAQDSYILATLPDGRTVQLYGNGQIKVMIGTKLFFYRLPTDGETPVANPTRTTRRK